MEITIEGSAKEIAALVLELQGRHLVSGDEEVPHDKIVDVYRSITELDRGTPPQNSHWGG